MGGAGNLVLEDPGGRKLRGESKFSPTGRGEPTPLDTMKGYNHEIWQVNIPRYCKKLTRSEFRFDFIDFLNKKLVKDSYYWPVKNHRKSKLRSL